MSDGTSQNLMTAVRRRATRPTPLGGPWWIYALSLGAANLLRQLLLPDDLDTWVQVATFVAMVIVVCAVVAAVSRVVTRGQRRRAEVRRGP